MDAPSPVLVSVVRPLRAERVLRDLVAAIDLVRGGTATRVVVANIAGVEALAAEALAYAQAAGVAFRLTRDVTGSVSVRIGPRGP